MTKSKVLVVTGTPTESSWSQAYTYHFGITDILLLISLHKQAGAFDLPMYGNKLAEDIHQQLITKLPLSLSELKHFIQTFTSSPPQLKLDLGLAVIKQNYLQFIAQGEITCLLFRHQPLILLQSPPKLTGLSGYLQPKDTLLITTTTLTHLIQPRLNFLLKDKHLQETLTRLIHAQTDSSQLTGLIYQLSPQRSTPSLPSLKLSRPKFFKPSHLKLKSNHPHNQTNRFIALALISFFFLSISFGFYKRTQLNKTQNFNQLQTQINHNLDQIKQLATSDPSQAYQLFQTSQQLVDTYRQQHSQDGYQTQLDQLSQQLQQLKTQLFHLQSIQLQPYLDLNDFTNQQPPTKLALDPQENLLALDTPSKVVLINLQDKSTLDLKLNSSHSDLALWNHQLFALTPDGVVTISLQKQTQTTVIKPGDLWQHPQFLQLYAGNIYLLDPQQGEIWKYPILDQGYGQPRRWFAAGITPDLSKVIDFKIDGQVWLLTSTGKLQAYLHGVLTKFQLHGLVSHLNQPTSFFLTKTEIFVLEPSNSRLLVFSKQDGTYLRQYLNQNFAQAHQIIIDHNWLYVWYDHYLARFKL